MVPLTTHPSISRASAKSKILLISTSSRYASSMASTFNSQLARFSGLYSLKKNSWLRHFDTQCLIWCVTSMIFTSFIKIQGKDISTKSQLLWLHDITNNFFFLYYIYYIYYILLHYTQLLSFIYIVVYIVFCWEVLYALYHPLYRHQIYISY